MVTVYDGRDNSWHTYSKEEFEWRLKWRREVEEVVSRACSIMGIISRLHREE
jgi:hypothetical protein